MGRRLGARGPERPPARRLRGVRLVTRFAPAPTGFLHLGHVVNALYVWGIADALGGRVLLRIEDHDRERSRPEYEQALLEDLDWLGFVPDGWDEGASPPSAFIRQSGRDAVYEAALDGLRRRGLVYACECSRAVIAALAPDATGERRYPGTCASKGLAEAPGRSVRVRLPVADVVFEDLRHGRQVQHPAAQCGDLVVKDRVGQWTYQLAATVDDVAQQITHVIRGDDLLPSTGRQILLARLLERASPPVFCHHPLVMKSAPQKLSKSDRDTGVRDLRAAGSTSSDVIGLAATAVGLLPAGRRAVARDARNLVWPIRRMSIW